MQERSQSGVCDEIAKSKSHASERRVGLIESRIVRLELRNELLLLWGASFDFCERLLMQPGRGNVSGQGYSIWICY